MSLCLKLGRAPVPELGGGELDKGQIAREVPFPLLVLGLSCFGLPFPLPLWVHTLCPGLLCVQFVLIWRCSQSFPRFILSPQTFEDISSMQPEEERSTDKMNSDKDNCMKPL